MIQKISQWWIRLIDFFSRAQEIPSAEEGWVPVHEIFPAHYACPIEIKCCGRDKPEIIYPTDLHIEVEDAASKGCVVYVRKTGIYKEWEEDEKVRAVANRLLGKRQSASASDLQQSMAGMLSAAAQQQPHLLGGVGGALSSIIGTP